MIPFMAWIWFQGIGGRFGRVLGVSVRPVRIIPV